MPAPEQDFVPFAAAPGANVLTQAEYLALTALGPGFSSGEAYSANCNKVWRQSSIIASAVAQLIADSTGETVIDDGTIATIEANLASLFRGLGKLGIDTGAVNACSVTLAPPPSAYVEGMDLTIIPAVSNTGASTLNINALGALPILYPNSSPLNPGALVAGIPVKLSMNSSKTAWVIGSNPTIPNATASNEPVALGQFPSSLGTTSGYKKWADSNSPSGFFITQWINVTIPPSSNSSGSTAFVFPIAFPNAFLLGLALQSGVSVPANISMSISGASVTGALLNWNGSLQGGTQVVAEVTGY
ncbi:MAG: hypothetical protein VST70_01725 [Nitrospirota bacterium]|nr:hypothetical protein [Nitrospirota bacterium]